MSRYIYYYIELVNKSYEDHKIMPTNFRLKAFTKQILKTKENKIFWANFIKIFLIFCIILLLCIILFVIWYKRINFDTKVVVEFISPITSIEDEDEQDYAKIIFK